MYGQAWITLVRRDTSIGVTYIHTILLRGFSVIFHFYYSGYLAAPHFNIPVC